MDTISAIATPQVPGGIGIVRISGPEACRVAQTVFCAKSGRPVEEMPGYTAAFGRALAGGEVLDECIALRFRAPRSYTGEDVVELSCHGGPYVMRRLLQATVEAGARLAGPGEFTRRAFLNGRIDLTRAEAVMQLIGARGAEAARAASAQQEGALFRHITALRGEIQEVAADLIGYIDFPDDDIPALEPPVLAKRLRKIRDALRELADSFHQGQLIYEGIDTAIVGRANAGKSTLMNRLAGAEASIVTEIPGTTRDVVERTVEFGGLTLRLADTAGLRDSADPVERIGVERARRRMAHAALVLAVFDASASLTGEDRRLAESLAGRTAVAVLNKSDRPSAIDEGYIRARFRHTVNLSAVSGQGLPALARAVAEAAGAGQLDPGEGILANQRQMECVARARRALDEALDATETGVTLDAVSVCVGGAADALAELTGEKASDAIIDRIFSKFCIGK